ncbi:MAG: 2,3-bisphosphoglycerate-independent phosphoglycerate mutase [Gammaproteobacteria bacterium]|nr:2,3-bisphosphoglycerate-independent phosphoglycerate mutase [Gammaproteobacteria bacterium]
MYTSAVPRKPTILIIMDGFGLNPDRSNNAVAQAKTPHLDDIFTNHPMAELGASGKDVGLPDDQMGNSEVGHLTIGSGTILRQDLVRIDSAIKDGSFQTNPTLKEKMAKSKSNNRPMHLIGLCSDGGVHSHIKHLYAFISMCKENDVRPSIHMITDGRDTPPKNAINYVKTLQSKVDEAHGVISSVSGRFYAMDRDRRWERTHKAWQTMVYGDNPFSGLAEQAIKEAYDANIGDEFIQPILLENGETIQAGDCVVFFNFRNDRARQLSYVLAGKEFLPFDRGEFDPIDLTCLTEYDPDLGCPTVFPPLFAEVTLAEVIANNGIHQFHCAETEKYAHVTFFLNGGREHPFPGEDREMIPSPMVETYDLAPQMSAKELADTLVNKLSKNNYGFIVCNFANGDMVGHTAKSDAVIKAVETLDKEVPRVIEAAISNGYSVLLTADHGNCELMVDPETGQPHTQHTHFPVPCVVIDDEITKLIPRGGLSQIAATILELMGLEVPTNMNKSLFSENCSKAFNAA